MQAQRCDVNRKFISPSSPFFLILRYSPSSAILSLFYNRHLKGKVLSCDQFEIYARALVARVISRNIQRGLYSEAHEIIDTALLWKEIPQ